MKLTLEFDGDEERDDLQVALDGYKWKNAMWELDQRLRKKPNTEQVNLKILTQQPGLNRPLQKQHENQLERY